MLCLADTKHTKMVCFALNQKCYLREVFAILFITQLTTNYNIVKILVFHNLVCYKIKILVQNCNNSITSKPSVSHKN